MPGQQTPKIARRVPDPNSPRESGWSLGMRLHNDKVPGAGPGILKAGGGGGGPTTYLKQFRG